MNWWEFDHPYNRPNRSLKLDHYYARKNIHVLKMAMILHFTDHTDMVINLEEVKAALALLDATEANMHYALSFDNRNPLAIIATRIAKWLRLGQRSSEEILIEFYEQGNRGEIQECLTFLVNTKKIYYNSRTKMFSVLSDTFAEPMKAVILEERPSPDQVDSCQGNPETVDQLPVSLVSEPETCNTHHILPEKTQD